jgi:hypothetical protein
VDEELFAVLRVGAAQARHRMEGADESARRAVNAPLETDDSHADRCRIRDGTDRPRWKRLKRHDELRHRLGLPNTFDPG